ncbi:MAG TPA: alpha-L-arabinofuranosidase C-terminal domain-containing protein [Lacipirellulaceae bacterium]
MTFIWAGNMIRQYIPWTALSRAISFLLCMAIAIVDGAWAQNYRVERIASDLAQPTFVTQAPGDPANIIYYSTRITAAEGAGGGFGTTNNMGGIFRYDMNTRTSTQVMNLSYRQLTGDEGLVGFAFSPDFNTPDSPGYQKMYVSSSQYSGNMNVAPTERVEEYTASGPGGTVPVDGSGHAVVSQLLLQYTNINANQNHTVDWIGFDPTTASLPVGSAERNYLYIAAGDGDLGGSAQTRPEQKATSVLGKVLRVDVDVADHGDAYPTDPNKNFAIPSTNPIPLWNASHSGAEQLNGTHLNYSGGSPRSADYTPAPGEMGEIYFTGTRNTFRMSIDRQTGDYWMGDVGENTREEVNFLKAGTYDGSQPPVDFGYAQREGTTATNGALAVANSSGATTVQWNLSGGGSVTVNSTNPVREGDHSATNTTDHPAGARSSYIGGYVYRGPIPELQGKYVYADFVNSNIFTLSDFDRNTPLASYSGTNFNQDPTTHLAALGTRATVATSNINSLWNALIFDPTDPGYTSALGSSFGIGRVVSFGEDNSGNLYVIDFGGVRGDPSFTSDYPNAGKGQIFELVPYLPGDYNSDGIVDAADYSVWRDHFGQTFQLPNEVTGTTPGTVTAEDYDAWKAHFGNTLSGSGAADHLAVPEPASGVLFILGALWQLRLRIRKGLGRRVPANLRATVVVSCAMCQTVFSHHVAQAAEPDATVTIDMKSAGRPVPKTLHGIFFEDINYGADGGLYAELVQNRSFEHHEPMFAWQEAAIGGAKGRLEVVNESPLNANNTHFLRIHSAVTDGGAYGATNDGFDGIVLKQNDAYLLSLYARQRAGDGRVLVVQLQDASGEVIAEHRFSGLTPAWQKLEAEIVAPKTTANAKLAVLVTVPGVIDVDMISLFPKRTFRDRRNGLRADLAQTLADIHPGFMRFPGGCVVEGMDLSNSYRWKDTIGDVAERKQNWNLWQDTKSPAYHQTYGLGFFEFFQFCEDIGAEPLPVVNCGMSCQARRRGTNVPLDELGPWIQDALDLVEFANGPVTSAWGARRAAMGHPESFHLKFLAVGNEQWNQEYFDRYVPFQKALKHEHPEIEVISTAGPHVNDPLWGFAWNKFRNGTPADLVDEHYYVPPHWLLENVDRYSSYDPAGPKIFVGEYAAHDGRARRNNLKAAVAEAAYMTGLVRHSDIVQLASYAPLLGKFGHDQWHPNLVWFDNTRVVKTPSYYVQALFAQNRPDVVLPSTVESPSSAPRPAGMVGVGTWNTQAEYRDLKVADANGKTLYESDFAQGMDDWRTAGGAWIVKDGSLCQTAGGTDVRAVVGDPAWTDYTFSLKARKRGGEEGFFIIFHTPNIEEPTWWNLGGWRNTSHAFQGGSVTEQLIPGNIESDRWYDIRIELAGGTIKGYLDGQLVQSAKLKPVNTVYAAAGRDEKSGELVLELVNPFADPRSVDVELQGDERGERAAKVIMLNNNDPDAENTLDASDMVTPHQSELPGFKSRFVVAAPPYSVQILRVPQ